MHTPILTYVDLEIIIIDLQYHTRNRIKDCGSEEHFLQNEKAWIVQALFICFVDERLERLM